MNNEETGVLNCDYVWRGLRPSLMDPDILCHRIISIAVVREHGTGLLRFWKLACTL